MAVQVNRITHLEAEQARDVVIVIDVIRAFTVAAYAFAGGVRRIWLVRTVEEAHILRERELDALLAGEIGGRLIPGFNFYNSPTLIAAADVRNRLLIQRTGAGTQGAVKARQASYLLICSLTNARATAAYARTLATANNSLITILPTATFERNEPRNEDDICAEYLEALLLNPAQAPDVLLDGIAYLHSTNRFQGFREGDFDFPVKDIPAILVADCFSFAMAGKHQQWQGITYVDVERVDIAL